jgi:hypothetical protein
MRWSSCAAAAAGALVAACATAPPAGPQAPTFNDQIVSEQWFKVPTRCGQGPYEIVLTTAGGRWQEDIDLQVESKPSVRLTAAILLDGTELVRRTATMGPRAFEEPNASPDNQFCLAGSTEVAEAVKNPRATTGAPGAGPPLGAPDHARSEPPAGAPIALSPIDRPRNGGWRLVEWTWRPPSAPNASRAAGNQVRIRIWSSVPNDFEGTQIGVIQKLYRPDVSDEAYDAWVVAKERWDREAAARQQAARTPEVVAAERERSERADKEAAARAEQERQQERQRKAYCESHPDDTDCWGAGGRGVQQEIARLRAQRDAYCPAHPDEARCWSDAEWARRRAAWTGHPTVKADAAPEPAGPPPPPRAEESPPRPSEPADWRPGYWYWVGADWIWIAGQWRVPEEDVRAERTTHAPVAPPAPPPENVPAPPAPVTVWTPGFWQWSARRGWVWVAGSWQLPPTPNLRWQPAHWTNRLGVFVFVPGGWIRVGRP